MTQSGRFFLGVVVAVAIGFLGFLSLRSEVMQPLFNSHDSPVGVNGGSIFGTSTSANGWTGAEGFYKTTGNNIGQLFTKGLEGVPNVLSPLNGWTISIETPNGKNSAMVCSDQNCTGQTLDSNGNIYFIASPGYRWTIHNGQLRFHDRKCDGDAGGAEHGNCDFFKSATITAIDTLKKPVTFQGACKRFYGEGFCSIGIGTK